MSCNESNALVDFCTESTDDDFKVEFEVLPVYNPADFNDERRQEICRNISDIDEKNKILEDKIAELDSEIDRLTNKADGIDYIAAVASGIICSTIDSFVVGEFRFAESKVRAVNNVNKFVEQKSENIRLNETIKSNIENAKEEARNNAYSMGTFRTVFLGLRHGNQKTL